MAFLLRPDGESKNRTSTSGPGALRFPGGRGLVGCRSRLRRSTEEGRGNSRLVVAAGEAFPLRRGGGATIRLGRRALRASGEERNRGEGDPGGEGDERGLRTVVEEPRHDAADEPPA